MSSTVNIDMCLIASKGLLPTENLHKLFKDTVNELNGDILKDRTLTIEGRLVGVVSLKERIIVQTSRYNSMPKIEQLRDVFNRRSEIAIKNYKFQLEQERKRIQESNLAEEELRKRIEQADQKIIEQEKAVQKQEMSSCDAIVIELKEAAENQGYDIVEEKTEEGVKLQFIRRVY